ncbi:MAG: amino acid permease [Actinomycetota bacterium]|nr:amino acid permease [Actinomycetota bacterium]
MTTTAGPGAQPGQAPAPLPLTTPSQVPETLGYRLKNRVLGPPLTSEQLHDQRLSKFAALGVLSPDCISSTAYGSEEMLRVLIPAVGVAAFSLLLPVTAAIVVILLFVTLSYREVVMVYTRTGGSYMVSRENFGPRVAQVAAAALIIDYTVTVAVQVAAGTAYVDSALPVLGRDHGPVIMSVAVVAVMCLANLRGIREASRVFVVPTYLFITAMAVLIVTGLVRAALGQLHAHPIDIHGAVHELHPVDHAGLLLGASVFVLLKSFANGGSSLTGLEAISNGVSAFHPPSGRNARRTLVVMSTILGTLVCGVSLLAHITHAVPYLSGYPTVVAQEADYVFGTHGWAHAGYYIVIVATVAILWTGGNTSFSGFPFLTSFVAHDAFLPNWLTKRGHRLVFSNGIVVLATVGSLLLIASGANVDALVAVYAIGVFTGFTMAGAGMVRYHRRTRESGWRRRQLINGFASVLSFVVVIVFAVTKFTQGAWVVVVLFPVLVYSFIRINRRYRREEEVMQLGAGRVTEAPPLRRHVAVLLVDQLDLATAHAIRYVRSLGPDTVKVVHFRIDPARTHLLEESWRQAGLKVPLEVLDCPDRRLGRATLDLIQPYLDGNTHVTVLLPRRDFGGLASRLLHDRTADRIAVVLSEVPNVSATIVPFQLSEARLARAKKSEERRSRPTRPTPPADLPGCQPIAGLEYRRRARVAGVVRSVEIQPRDGVQVLNCTLEDETGGINLIFSRGRVEGVEPSARLTAEGMVGEYEGALAIRNPTIELLAAATDETT